MNLWTTPTQQYRGVMTAVNSTRPAAVFRHHPWKKGTTNADLGGGRFDAATEFLSTIGVRNIIWDPFARGDDANLEALRQIRDHRAHTVTCTNVLNVIAEPENRLKLIREAADALRSGGRAIFQIYEGDGSGIGRETKPDCWQENRKAETYRLEILAARAFTCIDRVGGYIYCI